METTNNKNNVLETLSKKESRLVQNAIDGSDARLDYVNASNKLKGGNK